MVAQGKAGGWKPSQYGAGALVLVGAGAFVRLVLMVWLRPLSSFQPFLAPSYVVAAQDTLLLNIRAWGDRTPVYPLLVALCGLNPREIWMVQAILGVAASLMIFDMAYGRTRHAAYSLFAALACSLIPEALEFESLVMTEALTGFFLVASVWLMTRDERSNEGEIRYPWALGLVVGLAGLTRPLMICLVPVYYLFLAFPWPRAKSGQATGIRRTFAFGLPVGVLILGWCGFNYFNSGYFTPTTRSGQQLMDQVDPYVELAPGRFAGPRDLWLAMRRQYPRHPYATVEDVYEHAVPEMVKRTGKTEAQVSHEYASLAVYLEVHHPLLCLRRAEQGWIQFWGEPVGDWPQGGKVGPRELFVPIAYFLMGTAKSAFLVLSLVSLFLALLRVTRFAKLDLLVFGLVLWTSVFASFTEFGQNRRFCVPFYMLIVYTLSLKAWDWIGALSPREMSQPEP